MAASPSSGAANVRPATVDDAAAIAAVNVTSWRAAYAGIVRDAELAALSGGERRDRWERLLAGGGQVCVAERDGEICGYVAFGSDHGRDPTAGEVYALYVDPASWNVGLGRQLLATALAELAATGRTRTVLWTLASNARARRFFESAGFAADGAERPWQAGVITLTELRYTRTLLAAPSPTP